MFNRISKGPRTLTGSGGLPIPTRASDVPVTGPAVPASSTVGTGMDVNPEPGALAQVLTLLVPGIVVCVMVLVFYLSTQKK